MYNKELAAAENKVPRSTIVFHQIPRFIVTAIIHLMMSFISDSNFLNDMPELKSCWLLEPSFIRILITKGP